MCEFSGKTNNFDFFGPDLPKNWFWAWNFKNLSLDSESPPPRYQVCQFPVKMDKFEFFGLNLGKLPKCDILVLTILRVLQRAGWRLKWAGWKSIELGESWNELGGVGWSWVELGERFSNTQIHGQIIHDDRPFLVLSWMSYFEILEIQQGFLRYQNWVKIRTFIWRRRFLFFFKCKIYLKVKVQWKWKSHFLLGSITLSILLKIRHLIIWKQLNPLL